MPSLSGLLQQSSANGWLFIPTAILLGLLHGLEPGHSKTMMAGFIIAIRGTVGQAILLGLSAMVSHTAVVWVVALGGQYLGRDLDTAAAEPILQIVCALIVLCIGCWMLWRNRPQPAPHHAGHHHHGHDHHHHHEHEHGDAHQRAHAADLSRSFGGRPVTNGQIVMFGLTGGLIPCPAAITVLLLCLQVKHLWLGILLVACFSIGLAITMVAAGVAAAIGVRHVRRSWSGLDRLERRAPYASGLLMLAIALFMAVSGLMTLGGGSTI